MFDVKMQPVKILNNVQISTFPVECYYSAFNKDKVLSREYYREFTLEKIIYTVGNFILIKNEGDVGVAKIFCIFIGEAGTVQLVVRKYIFAKDIKDLLLEKGCTHFYDSEIIEDFTKDYIIPADRVVKKCFVIFAQENEDSDIIKASNLDSSVYFFCRYTLKADGLVGILSTASTILSENNLKSPVRRSYSVKKQKSKPGSENINICPKDIKNKAASPKDPHKTVKTSTTDTVCSPVQRNSVKRNLNESFGICPEETNNSILNYSIVSDEEIENPLLLKLRISERKQPFISIKKLNDVNCSKEKEEPKITPVRKSTRQIERKSYADYISPIKGRKRGNSTVSEHEELSKDLNDVRYSKNKNEELQQKSNEKFNTPRKSNSKENAVLDKRVIKTPVRYRDEWTPQMKQNSQGSARRSLRMTPSRAAQDVKSQGSANKMEMEVTTDVDVVSVEETPQKRANLDESFRRSVLKINLNKSNFEEIISNSNDFKKRRHKDECNNDSSDPSESEENDKSTNKNRITLANPSTPRRRQRQRSTTEIDVGISPSKTPKINRNMTPKSSTRQTPKTPKNRAKLIRDGVITPSMQSRTSIITGDKTPLMKARSQLHVSYVPNALPCRDKEYRAILNFVEDKLVDGCGGCIYISGVPGTGKTATVTSVINNLQQDEDVPKFVYVSINGMRLTEPKQSYVEILKQLTGKTVPWEQAQSILEEKFTKSKKMMPTVMLVDELDVLYTKRQDVVYNLLDWPSKAKNQLIVITIANTMDLPERLLVNKVASRLGLTRLTFQAYTYSQLQEIVIQRLSGTECFNPDAVQLVARKVASVSGDARRALDICRRAAEIAESESNSQLVNMNHVNKAVASMITQPKVRAIKSCSRLEQLILQSIVAEVERTGVEETTFSDVFKMLVSCAAIEGFKMVSVTNALSAVSRLSACRLILSDPKCNDISQKLILNVSVDDVYYALKKDLS